MEFLRVATDSNYLPELSALYMRAFPANERGPLAQLLDQSRSCTDVLAFTEGGEFCGFACLLTFGDITHILYLAMEENARGKGFGSKALELISAFKPGNRIIADLEAEIPGAANLDERRRRTQFYLRSGYKVSQVAYRWRGEDYVILVRGGTLTESEFDGFWRSFAPGGKAESQF